MLDGWDQALDEFVATLAEAHAWSAARTVTYVAALRWSLWYAILLRPTTI